jgi:hypothetical protein
MDIVLGLPETRNGSVGLLVFTEYLSKYPSVYPIKTKSANEVAKCLMDYISIFGPPKELSDQGREFVNEVIDSLSRATGIERRVTGLPSTDKWTD